MKRTTSRLFHQEVNPCLRVDKYPEEPDKRFIDKIEKVLEMRNYCLNEQWRDPHFLTFYLADLECGERLADLHGLAWTEPLKAADKEECSGWISFRTNQLFLQQAVYGFFLDQQIQQNILIITAIDVNCVIFISNLV